MISQDLARDWKSISSISDECSSGVFKYLTKFILRSRRNYGCICLQHDFDYNYGYKYGINRWKADKDLFDGIVASGHYMIATMVWSAVRLFGWQFYKKRKEDQSIEEIVHGKDL